MAREGLRMRAAALLAALALLGGTASVGATQRGNVGLDAGLRRPARLTAGDSDQLLGVLHPDASTLLFISNRDAMAGAYASRLGDGGVRALFDEGADVSLLRPSPDGRSLLYLSTRDDATGDVCLRSWPDLDKRRCLGDGRTAESFAFWYPDSSAIGVVARSTMHGEAVLRRVELSDGDAKVATAEVVVDRSVTTPAISRDGGWLVYVPVERASTTVGVQFAMQLGSGLHLRKLQGRGTDRVIRVDLPGVSGFPAFSPDGRWLYFVQSLGDTNHDGAIDGDDRSVVFRSAFDSRADPPVHLDRVEQLTSSAWSCRYPAPSRSDLVLTCESKGRLDVFSLPLDGMVPDSWSESRLQTALDATRDDDGRALLIQHLLRRTQSVTEQIDAWRSLALLRLRNDDLVATRWYARRARTAADGDPDASAKARVHGWTEAVLLLADHRQDTERLESGARDETYAEAQAVRRKQLTVLGESADVEVRTAARIVLAEIEDALGREEAAHAALTSIAVDQVHDPVTLRMLADLAVPQLRTLHADDAALALLARLCRAGELREVERLSLADRFVALLLRGRSQAERAALLDFWRTRSGPLALPADGVLAMRLELERSLSLVGKRGADGATRDEAQDEAARAEVFALYRRQRELDRRRAIVRATLAHAAAVDSGELLYQFANTWASFVPRDHPERPSAIGVFRQVALERAWIAWSSGKVGDARGNFFGVTLIDDDMEAHVGFAMARLRELGAWPSTLPLTARARQDQGRRLMAAATKVRAEVDTRYAKTPDAPPRRFLDAWLDLVGLDGMDDDARSAALERAEANLRVAADAPQPSRHVQMLLGWVAQRRFLAGEGRSFAVLAHDRYRLALELSSADMRLRGTLLHAIGLLQAAVGNHRLALESYAARTALPFDDDAVRVSLLLARARSRWHVGDGKGAVADGEAAILLCSAAPALAPILPLALDRTALYAFESGNHAAARAASERLITLPLQSGGTNLAVARANRARAALVLAATTLELADTKASRAALDVSAAALRDEQDDDFMAGRRAHQPKFEVDRTRLEALIDGLRARALLAEREPMPAIPLLQRRIAALADLDDGDPRLQARAAAHWHLALAHGLRGDRSAAMASIGAGLRDAERMALASGNEASAERIWLVEAAAELHLFAGASLAPLGRDLAVDAGKVYAALCRHGHPRWQRARDRLQLYLSILDARGSAAAGADRP